MKLTTLLIPLSMLLSFVAAGIGDQMGNGTYYDLGISLSSGYASISAHILPRNSIDNTASNPAARNLTASLNTNQFMDIAKLPGSQDYKNYMLGSQGGPLSAVSTPLLCPFSKRMCDEYWPSKTLQPVNPLAPMLQDLVQAAESRLETKIRSVLVTAYDLNTVDVTTTQRHVEAALGEMGVTNHGWLGNSDPLVIEALNVSQTQCTEWQAFGTGFEPEDEEERRREPTREIILTVDFTGESLTSALWVDECGMVDLRARITDWELGCKAMEMAQEYEENGMRFDEDFESALEVVCQKPRDLADTWFPKEDIHQEPVGDRWAFDSVGKHPVASPAREKLSAVLLMGENARDQKMNAALRKVLTKHFSNGEEVDFLRTEEISPDPAFVAARAAAWSEEGMQRKLEGSRAYYREQGVGR